MRAQLFLVAIAFSSVGYCASTSPTALPALAAVCARTGRVGAGANFTGTWDLAAQEGFDTFARAQGVPWLLRRLALLDRPVAVVHHGADGALKMRLTEAHATQAAAWSLGPAPTAAVAAEVAKGSEPSDDCAGAPEFLGRGGRSVAGATAAVRLRNPLREAVDVAVAWAPECPGVLVETHTNWHVPAHSVTM
jgi:hypothetical protein